MKFRVLFFALLLALISSNSLSAATFTWTGASNNDWNEQLNWSIGDGSDGNDGYPGSNLPTLDVVIINAGNPQVNISVTTGNVTINAGNLTIANGITLDIDGNIDIDGTLTFATSSSTCDVLGNWDDVDGTLAFSSGAPSVYLSGTGTVASNPTNAFLRLYIENGLYTAASNLTINSHFRIQNNGQFDVSTFTINQTSSSAQFLVGSGSSLLFGNTGTLNSDTRATGFNSTDGTITFTAAGTLKIAAENATIGTFNPGTGTVVYDRDDGIGNDQNIFNTAYNNLEIDGSGDKDVGANLTVNGNLTITNGTLDLTNDGAGNFDLTLATDFSMANGSLTAGTSVAHTVGGSWAETGGTFAPTAGTFTFNGDGKTITQSGNNFFNLTIAAGTKTAGSDLNIDGALLIDPGTLDMSGTNYTLDLEGDLTISNAGTFTPQGSTTHDVAGSWDDAGGTFTPGAGTIILSGDSKTITTAGGNNFFNLTIAAGTKTAGSDLDVNGALLIDPGTLDMSGTNYTLDLEGDLTISNAGTFTPQGSTTHDVAGSWNDAGGTFTPTGGTIILSGDSKTITTAGGNNFYGFTIAGTGNLTTGSSLDINGQTNILASGKLSIGSDNVDFGPTQQCNIAGELELSTATVVSNGSLNAGGGTIRFTDAGILQISGTTPDLGTLIPHTGTVVYDFGGPGTQNIFNTTYNNLEIDGSDDKRGPAGILVVNGNLEVKNGDLTFAANNTTLDLTGNFLISGGTFTAGTSASHDVDGNFTINGGNVILNSSIIDVNGNWDDVGGTLTAGTGTVSLSGGSGTTISTANANSFNNLTIAASGDVTTSTTVDVHVANTFTVTAGGAFTVAASHQLTLLAATIGGSLTATAAGSNAAIISFEDAASTSPSLSVAGTLTLTGTSSADRDAKILGDADSRIDVNITGTFSGTNFTFEYPDADGLHINSATQPTIDGGTFDNPMNGNTSCLLNLSNASTLPATIRNCIFNTTTTGNVDAASGSRNARSNASTDNVTFLDFSGTLADNSASPTAEDLDDDDDNKLTWFDGVWYSEEFSPDVSLVGSWFSDRFGGGFSPSNFDSPTDEFIVQSFHTAVPQSTWSPAGKLTIENNGEFQTDDETITIGGATVISNGGTLAINNAAGIFDAVGTFDADDGVGGIGNITFSAAGRLKLKSVTADLGTSLTVGTGTIEYDFAGQQNIFNTAYNNLEIDGSGDKDVGANLTVNGNLTITNGTLDLTNDGAGNFDLTLATDFSMANGSLTAGTSVAHTVGGSWAETGGTFAPTAGTFTFNGDGKTITQSGNNFFNLTIAAGTKTAGSDLNIDGALLIDPGTLDMSGTNYTLDLEGDLTISNAGTFTPQGSTTHDVAGSWDDAGGTFTPGAGTIILSGDSKTITTAGGNNFFNLTIAAGTKTAGSDLDVNGALLIDPGTLDMSGTNYTLDLEGDLTISNAGTFTPQGSTTHDVAGSWDDAGGTFTPGAGTIILSGDSKTITTAGGNNFFNLTIAAGTKTAGSDLDVNGALLIDPGTLDMSGTNYTLDLEGDLTISNAGTFTPQGSTTHDVAGSWDDAGGTFTPGAGTIILSGDSKTITTAGGNNFFNLTIAAGTKTAGSDLDVNGALLIDPGTLDMSGTNYTLDLEGDLTISNAGTFTPQGSTTHDVNGNWDDAGGTFAPGAGTFILSGGSGTTISTANANSFNNLTIAASGDVTTSTIVDVHVANTFTVTAGGAFTVAASHQLTLLAATIGGSLTATAAGSNAAIISFEDAASTSPSLSVAGTLTLTGTSSADRDAKILGDADSRIDVNITGTFSGTNFTFEYPDADGLHINSATQPTIDGGTFDNPMNGNTSCLLNLSNASTLPATISSCIFNTTTTGNVDAASGSRNARSNASTDNVTFLDFSGTLADNSASPTAEDLDDDDNDKISWFDGTWYSAGNNSPHNVLNWWDSRFGSGVNPSNFDNVEYEFVVQSSNNYIATDTWNPAGKLTVESGGTINPGDQTITIGGATVISNGGTLAINNAAGIFDAVGTFDADDGVGGIGNITFSAAGRLKLKSVTADLGTSLTVGTGTIEYDFAGQQNIFNTAYNNLEIDGSGDKDVGANLTVNGNLTITNGTLDLTNDGAGNFDLTLATDFSMANGSLTAGTSVAHTVGGSWAETGGTFAPTAGTFTFNGDGKTITQSGNNFFNLTIAAGTKTAGSDLNIDGALLIDPGTLDMSGTNYTLDLEGDLTISNAGTFTPQGSTTHDVAGSWDDAGGTFTPGAGTIILSGDSKTITTAGGNNFFNLTVGSGKKTAGSNLNIDGSLLIDQATSELDMTTNNYTLDLEGNFTMSNGTFTPHGSNFQIHKVKGDWDDFGGTFTGGYVNFDEITTSQIRSNPLNSFKRLSIGILHNKTCEAQSIITVTESLRIGGGSTLDMAGNDGSSVETIISGTLKLTTGQFTASGLTTVPTPDGKLNITDVGRFISTGEFNASDEVQFDGAGFLDLSGTVTSLGDFSAGTSTVTYNGSGPQNMPGTPTYHNLTIDNSVSDVTLTGSPQVDGTLTFTNGNITTNANSLIFGNSSPSTVPTATNTKHIIGNCSKIFGTSTEFTYPVGDDTLRPIKLTTNGGGSDVTTYQVTYQGNTGPDITDLGSGFTSPGGYVSGGAGSPNNGYHFDITRSSAGTPKDVTLSVSWTNTQLWGMQGGTGNEVDDLANMTFARYDGNQWQVEASSATGSQFNGVLTTVGSVSNFSNENFTLGSKDVGYFLPIELVSFSGECINNQTNLEFVVASQVNNDYFTIKRSTNNLEWEEVGFINGGGTNNEEITYTWTDHSPKSGVNYYKLFQTDIDGLSKSFSPIAINCESKVEDYHIYPNPTNGIVSVEFDLEYYQGDDIQMVLKDFKGVIVNSNPIELKRGYNYFEVDLSNLPNGFYVLSYFRNQKSYSL